VDGIYTLGNVVIIDLTHADLFFQTIFIHGFAKPKITQME
jgi:hypothetical protein